MLLARAVWLVLAVGALLTACAEMAPPPGGPVDRTPPALTAVEPGSLATRVDARAPLSFTFTEKLDRAAAKRALITVPEVALRRPDFDDLTLRFVPESTWPADTVVVWTLTTKLADRHRVALEEELTGAFTTGEAFPAGSDSGPCAASRADRGAQ